MALTPESYAVEEDFLMIASEDSVSGQSEAVVTFKEFFDKNQKLRHTFTLPEKEDVDGFHELLGLVVAYQEKNPTHGLDSLTERIAKHLKHLQWVEDSYDVIASSQRFLAGYRQKAENVERGPQKLAAKKRRFVNTYKCMSDNTLNVLGRSYPDFDNTWSHAEKVNFLAKMTCTE